MLFLNIHFAKKCYKALRDEKLFMRRMKSIELHSRIIGKWGDLVLLTIYLWDHIGYWRKYYGHPIMSSKEMECKVKHQLSKRWLSWVLYWNNYSSSMSNTPYIIKRRIMRKLCYEIYNISVSLNPVMRAILIHERLKMRSSWNFAGSGWSKTAVSFLRPKAHLIWRRVLLAK